MPIFLKVIISVSLSIISVLLFACLKDKSRKGCMAAMLLSTAGDLFMVNIFSLENINTYIGAGFFIAAHIVYVGVFTDNCKKRGYKYFSPGFFTGAAVMLFSVIALSAAEFGFANEKKPVMFCLILIYIAAIGYNLCSQFSYAFSKKGISLILPFAITVFYITDIFIFLNMLDINNDLRQYVWYFYPFAQLAIILFNSDLKKEKT
ncbi:MAG: lysoplasmalogenase family protein [Clostridia bacterium]|nr:lysoplasmalogenase family protein [Clostridia bacterium]